MYSEQDAEIYLKGKPDKKPNSFEPYTNRHVFLHNKEWH